MIAVACEFDGSSSGWSGRPKDAAGSAKDADRKRANYEMRDVKRRVAMDGPCEHWA